MGNAFNKHATAAALGASALLVLILVFSSPVEATHCTNPPGSLSCNYYPQYGGGGSHQAQCCGVTITRTACEGNAIVTARYTPTCKTTQPGGCGPTTKTVLSQTSCPSTTSWGGYYCKGNAVYRAQAVYAGRCSGTACASGPQTRTNEVFVQNCPSGQSCSNGACVVRAPVPTSTVKPSVFPLPTSLPTPIPTPNCFLRTPFGNVFCQPTPFPTPFPTLVPTPLPSASSTPRPTIAPTPVGTGQTCQSVGGSCVRQFKFGVNPCPAGQTISGASCPQRPLGAPGADVCCTAPLASPSVTVMPAPTCLPVVVPRCPIGSALAYPKGLDASGCALPPTCSTPSPVPTASTVPSSACDAAGGTCVFIDDAVVPGKTYNPCSNGGTQIPKAYCGAFQGLVGQICCTKPVVTPVATVLPPSSPGVTYGRACYSEKECPVQQGDATCVKSPAYAGDLCAGYRIANVGRECFSYAQCIAFNKGKCIPAPAYSGDKCGPNGYRRLLEPIDCPSVLDPVCGTGGKTYPNACEAKKANAAYKPGICKPKREIKGPGFKTPRGSSVKNAGISSVSIEISTSSAGLPPVVVPTASGVPLPLPTVAPTAVPTPNCLVRLPLFGGIGCSPTPVPLPFSVPTSAVTVVP